jgi:ubiquinone/menaquinone biosynthesis C-methylase UbiE
MSKTMKGYRGIGMNGFIASWYAKNTARSMDEYTKDARRVAERVAPGSRVLEVAAGPGYQAIALAKLGAYKITAIDISDSFVRIATENARAAGVDVEFQHGNASELLFAAESFDLVYCRAAFKNFSDPAQALEEMHRVLRPGGIALIQDLRPDATHEAIADTVRGLKLDRINSAITGWTFKHMLVKRAHSRQRLEAMAAASSFKACEIVESPIAYEVVLWKEGSSRERPELTVPHSAASQR